MLSWVQHVSIINAMSVVAELVFNLPQDSVLGLLLFVICVSMTANIVSPSMRCNFTQL